MYERKKIVLDSDGVTAVEVLYSRCKFCNWTSMTVSKYCIGNMTTLGALSTYTFRAPVFIHTEHIAITFYPCEHFNISNEHTAYFSLSLRLHKNLNMKRTREFGTAKLWQRFSGEIRKQTIIRDISFILGC